MLQESTCCSAGVTVVGNTTKHHVCDDCGKPCDVKAKPTTNYVQVCDCDICRKEDMNTCKTQQPKDWRERFDERFANRFHIAEHDGSTYSELGVQVDGEWENIKSFIASELKAQRVRVRRAVEGINEQYPIQSWKDIAMPEGSRSGDGWNKALEAVKYAIDQELKNGNDNDL